MGVQYSFFVSLFQSSHSSLFACNEKAVSDRDSRWILDFLLKGRLGFISAEEWLQVTLACGSLVLKM